MFYSVGSMLALDTPFISNYVTNGREESEELCLEYGSATQIYLVPVIQQEEQVSINMLRHSQERLATYKWNIGDIRVKKIKCSSKFKLTRNILEKAYN